MPAMKLNAKVCGKLLIVPCSDLALCTPPLKPPQSTFYTPFSWTGRPQHQYHFFVWPMHAKVLELVSKKIWYWKKSRNRSWREFGTEKSPGTGLGQIFGSRHTLDSFHEWFKVYSFHEWETSFSSPIGWKLLQRFPELASHWPKLV